MDIEAEADVLPAATEQQQEPPKEAAPEPVDPLAFYDEDAPSDTPDEGQDKGEASEEGEDGEKSEETPPVDPIPAPNSWSKDAKEVFTKLEALGPEGRALAETIVQREADRERFVQTKSREAATTRQAVETEARTALQTIMGNHARTMEQFLPPLPEMPNPQLLNTGDPQHRDLYYQQRAQYDYANAQRDQIAQQVEQARQHADLITQHQYQAEIQQEHQVLEEALGDEWSEPSSRAKLLETLQPIAAELGYPMEVIAQARATDIMALRRIGEIKAERDQFRVDAEKYRNLMKRKMEPVRAARQQLPPAARPGAAQGNTPSSDAATLLYPNDVRR